MGFAIPDRDNILICSLQRPDRFWVPPSLLPSEYWGVKRPEREINHLALSVLPLPFTSTWLCLYYISDCRNGFYETQSCIVDTRPLFDPNLSHFILSFRNINFNVILLSTPISLIWSPSLIYSDNILYSFSIFVVCS